MPRKKKKGYAYLWTLNYTFQVETDWNANLKAKEGESKRTARKTRE